MHPTMLLRQNFDLSVRTVPILLESPYVFAVTDPRIRLFLFCSSHHPTIDCVRVAIFEAIDPEILHRGIHIYFVHLRVRIVLCCWYVLFESDFYERD